MARDDEWDDGSWWGGYFPPAPPKLPPPEHGIKVRQFGSTWWGQRWIEALERFGPGYSARLRRGRTYARQGRVHDLAIKGGVVMARVTGSRPTPYRVTIQLAPLADRTWTRATKAMAARAVFAARLLSGEMPQEIDEAFRSAGASLFPERVKDLTTECSCPDWANPCKHIAAVHYVLGEAFDRDPFLLFELRGRDKAAVLQGLRRLRATSGGAPMASSGEPEDAPASVALDGIPAGGYETFREPVDGLRFHIGAPAAQGAVLRQLGSPPSWALRMTPLELLQPAVGRAAALARDLALAPMSLDDEEEAKAGPKARRKSPVSSLRKGKEDVGGGEPERDRPNCRRRTTNG